MIHTEISAVPIPGYLDDVQRPRPTHHGLHPRLRRLRVVDVTPTTTTTPLIPVLLNIIIANVRRPIRLRVVAHERVVVEDTVFLEKADRARRRAPAGRDVALRFCACEGLVDGDGSGEDGALLGFCEGRGGLVFVAVETTVAGWF